MELAGVHPGPGGWPDVLILATPIYLVLLANPLALGKRVGRQLWPHLAAVLASASFFHVARLSVVAAGYEDIIGALPLLQAALLGVVLVGLLRSNLRTAARWAGSPWSPARCSPSSPSRSRCSWTRSGSRSGGRSRARRWPGCSGGSRIADSSGGRSACWPLSSSAW